MKALRHILALVLCLGLAQAAVAATSGNVSGTYQSITTVSGKVSGTWQTIQQCYAKVSGTWQTTCLAFGGDVREYTTSSTNPGTDTIPSGSVSVTITVYGPGQQGQNAQPQDSDWLDGDGGTGGGKSVKTIAIDPADWGQQFTYTVGSSSSATFSQVDGSITAGTVNIDVSTSGSGGDTNTSGSAGGSGGNISGPGGSGGAGVDGVANGGSGAPGSDSAQGEFGGDGFIRFTYN